jgi:hypothetical protein
MFNDGTRSGLFERFGHGLALFLWDSVDKST